MQRHSNVLNGAIAAKISDVAGCIGTRLATVCTAADKVGDASVTDRDSQFSKRLVYNDLKRVCLISQIHSDALTRLRIWDIAKGGSLK